MLRIQICLEMSGEFLLDMSEDSWKRCFKYVYSIFLESHMLFPSFMCNCTKFGEIWRKIGHGAGGRGIQKRTKLVRILGVISDPPSIAQASLKHRPGITQASAKH